MQILLNLYNYYFGFSLDNPSHYRSMTTEKLKCLMAERGISPVDLLANRKSPKNTVLSHAIAANNVELIEYISSTTTTEQLNGPCWAIRTNDVEMCSVNALYYSLICTEASETSKKIQTAIQIIFLEKGVNPNIPKKDYGKFTTTPLAFCSGDNNHRSSQISLLKDYGATA